MKTRLHPVLCLLSLFLWSVYGHAQTTVNLASQCNCEVLSGNGTPSLGSPAASPGNLYIDINNGNLYSFDGTSWTAATSSSEPRRLIDADGDTWVNVERTADEDIIQFSAGGNNYAALDGTRFTLNSVGHNVYIGTLTGNGNGARNTAVGREALRNNTSGENNAAFGFWAMRNNTTGTNNTALGYQSLISNTIGNDNTSIGYLSQRFINSGSENTSVGKEALESNMIGNQNTAIGYKALEFNSSNGITGVGYLALAKNTSGTRNTAVGWQAIQNNSSGDFNTGVGYNVLSANTFGSMNTAMGEFTLFSNTTGNENLAIGRNAMGLNVTGSENTAIGTNALYQNVGSSYNTAVGSKSLNRNNGGIRNVGLGAYALFQNINGVQNTASGTYALTNNISGAGNVANGDQALNSNISGGGNTGVGFQAARGNTTGGQNTAIGRNSLYTNTSGIHNTALGASSYYSGNFNNATTIGYFAIAGGDNTVRVGNNSVTSIGGGVAWSTLSDGRFKTSVKENVKGLEFISLLRPVTYKLDKEAISTFNNVPAEVRNLNAETNKRTEIHSGFIAQEVEAAAKSIGYEFHGVDHPQHDDGHYGLRYAEFVVPLVKAVQEQQETIKKMEKQLQKQAALIQQLLDENDK